MSKTIVLYHGGCRDGFCSAWVYWKYLKETHTEGEGLDWPMVQFIPAFYGQEPPDCKDADVIIVDFCYPLEIMCNIISEANSVIWLDHHKTAQEVADYLDKNDSRTYRPKHVFDNSRSGAGIAWDYFFPNQLRPWLVDYVEDRDLWLKKLPNTDRINAYIACLEFSFDVWDKASEHDILKAEVHGISAEMKTEQYVREVCKNVYFASISNPEAIKDSIFDQHFIAGWTVPIVNICQVDCSEVLHELCKRYPSFPFSLYWFKRQDGLYQYGLRSIGDFDVSLIAKLFGGGGHRNASGFQLPYLLEELK